MLILENGKKNTPCVYKNTRTNTHMYIYKYIYIYIYESFKEYNTTVNTKLLCLYNNDSNVLTDSAFGHVLLQKLTYVDVQIWHVLCQFPSA